MPEFRVLTVKEQSRITSLLNDANEALVAANAIVADEVAKARKPRKPRATKTEKAAPAVAPKRRGRPPKVEAPVADL